MRQLFCFWQFDGDNTSWCNQFCPYCYGGKKKMRHYWSGDVGRWEEAFVRLGRDMYFVMSYGESMGMKGFYDCVDMIGEHPSWTLCLVTNLSFSPERLINSRLGRERRVFVNPCWHPLGVSDRVKGWDVFRRHVLMLKDAGVPVHVLYLWYKPQIKWFPEYFGWLDKHDIRVSVRRYIGRVGGWRLPLPKSRFISVGGEKYPDSYSVGERGYLYSSTCRKVLDYGVELKNTRGKLCSAGKDMILVKYDGTVGLCADCHSYHLGNIFDDDFGLRNVPVRCPVRLCGGDYGMLHLQGYSGERLPERLECDTFVSQVEGIRSPVDYRDREGMLRCLEMIRCGK